MTKLNKVIFINSLSNGGAERVVSRLFSNTQILKIATLVTFSRCETDFYKINSHNRVSLGKKSLFRTMFSTFRFLFSLDSSNVVQAHLNKPIIYSALAKYIGAEYHLQSVHCFAYSGLHGSHKKFIGHFKHILFSRLLKKVDHHIFKSHEMVQDFKRTFRWLPKSYEVIQNPYDFINIKEMSKNPMSFPEFRKDMINVVVVGRMIQSKGIEDIIELAKLNQDRFYFHFLGNGELLEQLQSETERHLNNVTFYGNCKNPYNIMKSAQIYLSCSRSEGFPNTLIEALSLGLLCVHSDCPTGPKEILADVDFRLLSNFKVVNRGVLFKTGSIEAAHEALNFAGNHLERLNSFSSMSDYLQSLDVDVVAERYVSTLNYKFGPS